MNKNEFAQAVEALQNLNEEWGYEGKEPFEVAVERLQDLLEEWGWYDNEK